MTSLHHEWLLTVGASEKPDCCISERLLKVAEPLGYLIKGEASQRLVKSAVVSLGDIRRRANIARGCRSYYQLLIGVKFRWRPDCNCIGSVVND